MRLLIVNDEVLTTDTMKRDMRWENYGIHDALTAYDAKGAKECLKEHEIDVMLCDIEMPGENGIELLRWVKQNYPDIECIFLTCHADFEYAREAMSLGCQDYLLIPAKYDEIGAIVKKVVNRIEEKREAKQFQEYGRQAFQQKVDSAVNDYGEKKPPEAIVREAMSYIMEHLSSDTLSVEEVAEQLFIHPVYLNRVFRKVKGESVRQIIITEKMKLAVALLKTGRLTTTTVAEQVGYKSYSNFALMFRKHYGCAPSQYQKEIRPEEQEENDITE